MLCDWKERSGVATKKGTAFAKGAYEKGKVALAEKREVFTQKREEKRKDQV